jgi:hypothetical protein
MVITSNYNSLATAHTKYSQAVFTIRFLVTDPNNVLCLRPYWLVNVSQTTLRLSAISHQHPAHLIDSNSTNCSSQLFPFITSRHGPHRKYLSYCCRWTVAVWKCLFAKVTALAYLPISRSLHSIGFTCYTVEFSFLVLFYISLTVESIWGDRHGVIQFVTLNPGMWH